VNGTAWKIISIIELLIALVFIALDLLIPTLIVCALMLVSFRLRHQSFGDLNFKKPNGWKRLILTVLVLSAVWTLVDLGLILPILGHLMARQQDLSAFSDIKGNLGALGLFLVATWTLAAFGEEIVYRGYIQLRTIDIMGKTAFGVGAAVIVSSIFFGLAHTEQGLIGVGVTFFDGLFFSLVKRRFDNNLWVSVFAHGFNNTIGLIGFFFIGPIYAIW
jgi:uncharacterized protein